MSYNLPQRKLVSQADASMIARPDVPRSTFSGSWSRRTTFDAGLLIPFLVDEILPGDHMKYDIMAYIRMATPVFPLMDNQRIDTHIFYVPNRLLWPNWRQFMGQQLDPGSAAPSAYSIPQCVSATGGFPANSIADHFGLPVAGQITAGQTISVSALPFRAYNLIYNEWFRDQNLINSAFQNFGDTANFIADFPVRRRAKSHDYFTSALPFPQKFSVGALSQQAPVVGLGIQPTGLVPSGSVTVKDSVATGLVYTNHFPNTGIVLRAAGSAAGSLPSVFADVQFSINAFRQAMLTQQLLERDARGGTRYTELVKAHFGVESPDARQQRPEYIGGGSQPLQVTPVADTNGAGSTLGILGGAGTAVGSHSASYAATEHGYVIGLISVRSELSYSQGIHRMWTRTAREEFYFPSLAQLGEQAVLRKELFATGVVGDDNTTFGFQERWQEYRTRTSEVTGMFRPTTAGNIAPWHLSQQLAAPVTLGQTFIEDSPPMSRVLIGGANTNQQYLADFLIKRVATRPIPMYGTPATLGRF